MQRLSLDDFNGFQLKWKEPTLIFIYGDYCSHCNSFKPVLSKFFNSMKKSSLRLGLIQLDSKNPNEQTLVKSLKNKIPIQIQGVPSVLLYNQGKYIANFDGPRTEAGLRKFIGL